MPNDIQTLRIEQLKRKRKQEEDKQPQPVTGTFTRPDAGTRAANIAKAYFGKTGKLPSPEKMIAFVKATEKTNLTPDQYDAFFPDWVKEMKDPQDIKLWEFTIDRVQRQLASKYTAAKPAVPELEKPQKTTPAAQPAPPVADNPTVKRIKLEMADRATLGARASEFFYDNGDEDDKAINTFLSKHERDKSVMDAASISLLRKQYMKKDRDELSQEEQTDLDALALKLSSLYDSDGFAEHYGNDLQNVTWDKFFDKHVMWYVMGANIGHAMRDTEKATPEQLEKKKTAMKNIELATHGVVKGDADLREYTELIGLMGDPTTGLSANDQMADFIYTGYSNAKRDSWTEQRTLANYVAEFGVEWLPTDKAKIYEENMSDWERYMTSADDVVGQMREKAAEYGGGEALIDVMIEEATGDSSDIPVGTGIEPGDVPLEEPKGELESAMGLPTGKALDPKTRHYVRTYIAPKVGTALAPVADVLTWSQIKYNQAMMTAYLLDKQQAWETAEAAARARGETIDGRPLAYDRDKKGSFLENLVTMGNAGAIDKMVAAWDQAEDIAVNNPNGTAWMDQMFRDNGINPDEHRTWVFISDLVASVVVGAPAEAGVMALSKAGWKVSASTSAKLARKSLSPKLALRTADATVDAAEAEADVLRMERALRTTKGQAAVEKDATKAAAKAAKAKTIAAQLKRARTTQADARLAKGLLDRPAWYDTMAVGLSKSKQSGHQLYRVFSVDEYGMPEPTRDNMYKILDQIGDATDPDEITRLMVTLRGAPYLQNIDPATLWIGRQNKYARWVVGEDTYQSSAMVNPKGRRIERGAEEIYSNIERVARQTNMGLGVADKSLSIKIMNELLEKAWKVSGKTPEEVQFGRQAVYREMWDTIEANMRKRGTPKRQADTIRKFARIKGIADNELDFTDEWTTYRSYLLAKRSRTKLVREKGGPNYGQGRERPELTDKDAALGRQKTPMLEVQLAKDLYDPQDIADLVNFQRGHIFAELVQNTGAWGVGGPTITGATAAFRTLALARMGFGLSALMIDEFWRQPFEKAFWTQRVAHPLQRRTAVQIAKDNGQFDRAASNAVTELMHNNEVLDPIAPGSVDYHPMFSAFTKQLQNEPVVKEVFLDMTREPGESLDSFMARFEKEMTDKIFEDSRTGEVMRLHMGQMKKDLKGEYRNPQEVTQAQEQYDKTLRDLFSDYQDKKAARDALNKENQSLKKSPTPDADRLAEVSTDLKRVRTEARQAYQALQRAERKGRPALALGKRAQEWVEGVSDNLRVYAADDTLMNSLRTNGKVSRRQLKRAEENLRNQGVPMKIIAGVRAAPHSQPGSLPVITRFAEWGPYRLLQAMSNATRRATFSDHYSAYLQEFLDAGLDEKVAAARAGFRAQKATDRAMYTPGWSMAEHNLSNVFLFMPAYRQAALYWGKTLAKHPVVLPMLADKMNTDYLSVSVGDYRMALPMPLWATGSPADMATPGMSAPVLLPLRALNYATGWAKTDDGNYEYTGATKLDQLSSIPPLAFMDKSTSPMMEFDDLGWGMKPNWFDVPGQEGNFLGVLMTSGFMSLWRDPMKRQQHAVNLADSMTSRGVKPDFKQAISEMAEQPFWWKALTGTGMVENPDAVLSALTRTLFVNRVRYTPSDLEAAKKGDWGQLLFGKQARTMVEAKWEYQQAYGDVAKQRDIERKYPELRALNDFYKMNAAQRAEFWADDKNLWLFPFTNSKNSYTAEGRPLIGSEYYLQLKEGGVYRKNREQYLEDMDKKWLNIGWDRKLKIIESNKDRDMKTAKKFALDAINRIAAGDKERKERLLTEYDIFYNGWLDGSADGKYGEGKQSLDWLVVAAQDAGIEDEIFKWNPDSIMQRYWDDRSIIGSGETIEGVGQRPEGADTNGVEGQFENNGLYGVKNKTRRMGVRAFTDAMQETVPSRYRRLFDVKSSISYEGLKKSIEDDDMWRNRTILKLASNEWWKTSDIFYDYSSVGVPVSQDIRRIKNDLDSLYSKYNTRLGDLYPTSKEGRVIRAWYIGERDKILSRDAATPLRDGPAGRLMFTYLTDPGGGQKVDKNYVKHAVAVMGRGNVDYERLLLDWESLGKEVNLPSATASRVRSATAWASVLAVAIDYRRKMKSQWNDSMKSKGVSPDSKAGKVYLQKLTWYVSIWKSRSDTFKTEWDEAGGDKMIPTFLDVLY